MTAPASPGHEPCNRISGWAASLDGKGERLISRLDGKRWADLSLYALTGAAEHGILWQCLALVRALRGERRAAMRASIGLLCESLIVNGIVKSLFRRSRPLHEGPRPLPLRRPRTSSFPSGHASDAAFALVVLGQGDAWWPLYAWLGALVTLSRLHVRMHHASDLLGGLATGTALGLVARRLAPLREAPRRRHTPGASTSTDEGGITPVAQTLGLS